MKRLLSFAILATFARAQESAVFTTGVSLVHVDVEVVDGSRLLNGFTKDSFRILDNGVPQKILHFSQEEEPIDIILLFDVSGSMKPKLERVAVAAHAALAELRPGDRVAVMTFTGRARMLAHFTEDVAAVERTIEREVLQRARGGTRILASIDDAAKVFWQEPRTRRRRAVLIVTDNHGMVSGNASNVVHNLWEADAILSGLEVRHGGETAALTVRKIMNPMALALDSESMSKVAEQTGGDVLKGGDPGANFQEMIRRIRLRYSLYYAQPEAKPGTERKIKVTLADDEQRKHPQGHVRARFGYRVPGN
ncbi:MAG TPA: VWA domain-containing protein [Bryobacteraceae bacterium]|jgi:VWFA-related protein|nr:VWA domain-containing protein [Bryobacteraceae bacterium]